MLSKQDKQYIDQRFDEQNRNHEQLDEGVRYGFEQVNEEFGRVYEKFSLVHEEFARINNKIDIMINMLQQSLNRMEKHDYQLSGLQSRVTHLESAVF